jgi:tRNA U54 and U55 pseudouridine synthase Pus10
MVFKDRRKKYDEMREVKRASFHKEKDADILKHLKDKEFSTYIKKLIREDMNKTPPS